VTAIAFVIGTTREADEAHTDEPSAHADEQTGEEAEHAEEGDETILGLDPESPALVAAAAVASLALAIGLWVTRNRALAVVAAAFGIGFAVPGRHRAAPPAGRVPDRARPPGRRDRGRARRRGRGIGWRGLSRIGPRVPALTDPSPAGPLCDARLPGAVSGADPSQWLPRSEGSWRKVTVADGHPPSTHQGRSGPLFLQRPREDSTLRRTV
jgi:hypothetical protein